MLRSRTMIRLQILSVSTVGVRIGCRTGVIQGPLNTAKIASVPRPFPIAVIAAVVALLVLGTVGLYQHVNRTPPASDLPPTAAAPSTADRNEGPVYEFDPVSSMSIDIYDNGLVINATRGQCDGKAKGEVRVSANGGKRISTPDVGLKEIVAVEARPRGRLTVVGAGADCVARQVSSGDGGVTWTPDAAITIWYPSLDDVDEVVSPDGRTKVGCPVTSLSQVGKNFARASCSDGRIRGTGNGGKEWVTLGRLDHVRVASFATFTKGYALARHQGCAAQTFVTQDSGRSWERGGCITGDPAQAIGSSDIGLVAVVGDELYASSDSGSTWTQP